MNSTEVILTFFAGVAAIWALAKVLLPRFVEAKLKADEYERLRSAFREDKTFDMLTETLEYLKEIHEAEREEMREGRAQQAELIKSINRIAANVDQHTGIIRLLVQQVTVFDDQLREIKTAVTHQAANTRPLRNTTAE